MFFISWLTYLLNIIERRLVLFLYLEKLFIFLNRTKVLLLLLNSSIFAENIWG